MAQQSRLWGFIAVFGVLSLFVAAFTGIFFSYGLAMMPDVLEESGVLHRSVGMNSAVYGSFFFCSSTSSLQSTGRKTLE